MPIQYWCRVAFSASHRKGFCDPIGSTTNWQTARASHQHRYTQQILTPDFYEFSHENIHGIKYFYVSQVEITETETEIK